LEEEEPGTDSQIFVSSISEIVIGYLYDQIIHSVTLDITNKSSITFTLDRENSDAVLKST